MDKNMYKKQVGKINFAIEDKTRVLISITKHIAIKDK